MTVEFTSKLPDEVPASLPVYRLQRPDSGPAAASQLLELAKRIGLDGFVHETCTAEDWTMQQLGAWELGVHARSGAIVGRDRARYQRATETAFELSDDDAAAIASQFLGRADLAARDEVRLRRVTHLRSAGGETGGEAKDSTVLDAGVVLGRQLGDVEVTGPGGFTMINVNADKEVVGFRSVWRQIADMVGDVEVRPPDVANRAIERIAGSVRGDVEVTTATFGYFEQGVIDAQSFLQPAYAVVYVVRDGEVAYRSAEVIAAAEKEFEPLLGAKRFGDVAQGDRGKPAARRQG